jgi:hypothetical protein
MSVRTPIAATVLALVATSAPAASIDLEALGLRQRAPIAQTDQAIVVFDALSGALTADGDDGTTFGFLTAFLAPSLDVVLTLFEPPAVEAVFEGNLVAYDIDTTHGVGLFYDDTTMTYLLGEVTAPAGAAFDFTGDFFFAASAVIYDVAPVPLPAAMGLLAAGLAALTGLGAVNRREDSTREND